MEHQAMGMECDSERKFQSLVELDDPNPIHNFTADIFQEFRKELADPGFYKEIEKKLADPNNPSNKIDKDEGHRFFKNLIKKEVKKKTVPCFRFCGVLFILLALIYNFVL